MAFNKAKGFANGPIPQHIIQRGNNRQACFYADDDHQFYLECLGEAAGKYRVSIHAYVLMTNHAHVLMTPTSATGIGRVMQTLGRCYVRYINQTYRRSGTLWEGRYHVSLVQGERYLLTYHRYIELNPVRASMSDDPSEYRWSSYHHNALGQPDKLIESHRPRTPTEYVAKRFSKRQPMQWTPGRCSLALTDADSGTKQRIGASG